MIHRLLIQAVALVVLVPPSTTWAMFPEEELTTDKSVYFRGELVDISLNVSNTTTETILLWTGMCGCTAFAVEILDSNGAVASSYMDPYMCIAMPCAYCYEPGFEGDLTGESTFYDWNQAAFLYNNTPGGGGALVTPGEYTIRVVWHDGTDLSSPPFEILAQAPPIPTASDTGLVILCLAIGFVGALIVRRCL